MTFYLKRKSSHKGERDAGKPEELFPPVSASGAGVIANVSGTN